MSGPHAPARPAAAPARPRPPGPAPAAAAGVELGPAALDERPARADEAIALDLLGVTTRRREDQDRGAVVAPPGKTNRLLQTLGVPAAGHLHVVHPDMAATTGQGGRGAGRRGGGR